MDDKSRFECDFFWCLDPIDGTRSYISGKPEYTISLALINNFQPILGIIYNPTTNEYFHAEKNKGAFCNNRQIKVNSKTNYEVCSLAISSSEMNILKSYNFFNSKDVKKIGSIAYKIALVAKGNIDIAISLTKKNDWDLAAADLLIREAHGKIMQTNGEKIIYNTQNLNINSVMAANVDIILDLKKKFNQFIMNTQVSTKQILKRLFNSYIKKHYIKIFISIICMVIVAAATATNAWLMQPVLDDIFINKNKDYIIIIPVVILLIAFVKGIASYFQSVLMSFVGYKIVADLQRHMLTTLLKCDLSFFNTTNSGTLVSRFLADVGALSRGVHNVIINIVKDSLTFIFLLGVMFHHDPKLATITLLIFPLAIYPISKDRKKIKKNFEKYSSRFWFTNQKTH